MADRYWVGGTADWDGTAGTKWAATSGGAGGESVPTTADDVFFDANSSGTVTIASGNTGAASINCTGFTGTIAGSAGITVAGSITLDAGQTYTHTGIVTITGTGTLTTAGKAFSNVTVNGSGITVTLGDALDIGDRAISVIGGTFDTANYAVSCFTFSSSATATRVISLGSSTVNGTNFNFNTSVNLTFNAGTSQINAAGATSNFQGGNLTFYNVSFTSTSANTRTITGANTFNDLTLNASASGLSQLSISADQTVNGTFTCAGSSAIQRGFVRSNTIGTTRTITANAISANDCDFRDITIAGTAAGASPTRAGDCGGNSGITFPAAKTVYWNPTTATGFDSSAAWVTTSGGTDRSADNFPLAQDTAVFDENSTANMGSNNTDVWNVGTMDLSARTSAFSFGFGNRGFNIYGDWTTGSGVTYSGNVTTSFLGRSTQTFTSAGKTWPGSIKVDKPAGAFELGDAFETSNNIELDNGTFDAKTYNVTAKIVTLTGSEIKTLNMGSGLWTLTGISTVWNATFAPNLTINKGTADILLSDNTTSTKTFQGAEGFSYNKLTIGGNTSTSITALGDANSTFTLTELASTKTVSHTIRFGTFTNKRITIDTWSVTGTSGNVVTVNSSTAGTRRTFNLTNYTRGIDYLNVQDIGITDANKFYVGANSIDSGNNLNVIFTRTPNINVSNLVGELGKKIDASLSKEDILYYTKAIQQLRTGNVFVVSYVSNLPAPSTVLGSLYYVNETEILYVATVYGWVEIYTSTVNTIFSWGSNSGFRLGDGTVTSRCSPVREFCSATNWCQVSASKNGNVAAIKTSGELWAWGSGSCGRLGDGVTANRCSPVREFCFATDWCQVSAGCVTTSAVKTSGELWAWGSNGCGALGDGTVTTKCSPVREISSATDWCQVGVGRQHVSAIKTSGQIWSWGCNSVGNLGDGTVTDKCSPVREICSATDWCQVSIGIGRHTMAIKTSGELWGWGYNGNGQLGIGVAASGTGRCSPVREICSATDWCQVTAGNYHTLSVKTSGELWAWGRNSCGQLSDGTKTTRCSPVREICSATDWCQVSAGGYHTAALKTSGELWSWGDNVGFSLGDGTTTNSCSPVREITSATSWCQVSAGSCHTAAIQTITF